VWTYLVTNPGNASLTITSIRDDAGSPGVPDFTPQFVGGDSNNNSKLDPGETWRYTSAGTFTYTVVPNLYGNLAMVVASTSGGQILTASDPSYHLGNAPAIFVQKAINALDPMNPTSDELAQAAPGRALPIGTAVVWTYKVYNTGEGPIQVTYLRDDAGTPANPADDFSPTPVLRSGSNFNLGDMDTDGLLDLNEAWLYTSTGTGSGTATSPNWSRVSQDIVNATDTRGNGQTPGFATDPVGTPNTFSDAIFTGGGSKDTNGIAKWQWKMQQPQDKDDIAHAFGASYADPATGRQLAFGGLDRYSANGNATIGFWFLQQSVAAAPGGTFSGTHSDGDLLFVVDVASSVSSPVVKVFRWTGTDASGQLTQLSVPAGSTFALVNTAQVSVPWSFIDKAGFTSPQAGELIQIGVDLTRLFGTNVPRYVSFLAETRSSNSTSATLSDFALGSVNTVHTRYTVKPGPYSNTVTAFAKDPTNGATFTATDTNYHFGVASGPQLAAFAPPKPVAGPMLTEAELAPIVAEAKARWAARGASLEVLNAYSINIADLPDGPGSPTLGYASDTVTLDINAGGFGWFIDPTPGDDVEFENAWGTGQLSAHAGSPVQGRMDLLTVVMHELGHVLGLPDLDPREESYHLMAATLAPGVRRSVPVDNDARSIQKFPASSFLTPAENFNLGQASPRDLVRAGSPSWPRSPSWSNQFGELALVPDINLSTDPARRTNYLRGAQAPVGGYNTILARLTHSEINSMLTLRKEDDADVSIAPLWLNDDLVLPLVEQPPYRPGTTPRTK